MKSFKSEEVRNLDDIQEGCLTRYDSTINRLYAFVIEGHDATATTGANDRGIVLPKLTRLNTTGIANGKFVRMGHKPCCGFVQSGYYPPIRYCPLEFIFEICSDPQEPVINPATQGASQAADDNNGLYFTTRNTTTSWKIQNCILRCELITVDNSVNNNVVSHLLKGGRLRMVYPAYHSFSQTFAAGNTEINMNIVKSSTRLSQMFFTLSNSDIQTNNIKDRFALKKWTYFFYHPMRVTIDNVRGVVDSDKQISYYVQIANKKFPEQAIESIAESMYFLRRAVNVMSPFYDGFSIDIYRYTNDKFIGGINFDKQPDMNFTGSNTKMGSLLTFKLKGANQTFALGIEQVYVTLVSEHVFELSESASTVLD